MLIYRDLHDKGYVRVLFIDTTLTPGVSVPVSKFGGGNYFYPGPGGYYAGSTASFSADGGNNIFYFANNNTLPSTAGSAPFTPEDAWNIDTKLDDGKPGTGTIISTKGDATNSFCTTGDNIAPPGDVNATYQLNKTAKDCALEFLRVFCDHIDFTRIAT